MSALVSTRSASFTHEQVPHTDCILTSLASFNSLGPYIRNSLIATRASPKPPSQISVSFPGAAKTFPPFFSPAERVAEDGGHAIALHTFPRAIMYFVVCGSRVGYIFVEMMDRFFRKRRRSSVNVPDQPCRRISSDPLLRIPERCGLDPCY
jgi:hypothetical protein